MITEGMADMFRKGRTQDGLTCVVIDKVVHCLKFALHRCSVMIMLLLWYF